MALPHFQGDDSGKMKDGRFSQSSAHHQSLSVCLLILSLFAPMLTSCRTAPLSAIDLSAPGWHVLQGQAVWRPPGNRPELTGDLLLATNADGNFFIQFTKDPFPLVTAEAMNGEWQIAFGADEHPWRGRGEPSIRFGWLQLPRALKDGKVSGSWQFTNMTTNTWRLENSRTGERLEGGFFP